MDEEVPLGTGGWEEERTNAWLAAPSVYMPFTETTECEGRRLHCLRLHYSVHGN